MKSWAVRCSPLVLCLVLSMVTPVVACTSFATYGGEPMYGMNFDYEGHPEVRFGIETGRNGFHLLYMGFETPYGFVLQSGLNNRGLFGVLQMVPDPQQTGVRNPLNIGALHQQALTTVDTTRGVEAIIGRRRLVPPVGFHLHAFFADVKGGTLIAEPGPIGNQLVKGSGAFSVMTNFYHGDYVGKSHDEILRCGDRRYRSVWSGLCEVDGVLSVAEAFRLLKEAGQSMTRVTMVMLPKQGQIFVALDLSLDRIWLIDLSQKRMGTHSGFEEPMQVSLGSAGVSSTELELWK